MTEKSGIDPVYPYIENKVKTLKGQITKLRNRIETLEISSFQDQIAALDKKIDLLMNGLNKLIASHTELETFVIASRLLSVSSEIYEIIKCSDLPLSDCQSLQTQLLADVANSKHEILKSKEPLAQLSAFRKKWIDLLHNRGCQFFDV